MRDILVVDDNAALRQLATMALSMEGYSVREAAHGIAALSEVERSLPGLILLDLKMPQMDGAEFAKRFREIYGAEVPILIMTAADDVRERVEATGESNWIAKPFDLGDLLDQIKGLLEGSA